MATKQQNALTPAAAMTARRMYAETDSRGRRIHSMAGIAKFLGTSETTVYRAVNGLGPYMSLPEPQTDVQMDLQASASLQRLLQGNPELIAQAGAQPDVLDKLAQDIEQKKRDMRKGDDLLDELKGEEK